MMKVRQRFPESPAMDPARVIRRDLCPLVRGLKPGARVAVAVGSRGISNLRAMVMAALETLREAGACPFIVPAMGSHGGGTPEGQIAILAGYGITAETMGVPIEATMDVERLGVTSEGFDLCFSTVAWQADGVLLINRIKPHTDFRGDLGSGLMKMMVVGLGKRAGAANFHSAASRLGYEEIIRSSGRIILKSAPILAGIAILENQRHETTKIAVLRPDEIESAEGLLCAEARSLMPRLPFKEIDLLIVDRLGKNISGTGMDPAVIGRSIHGYTLCDDLMEGEPKVRRLFVRELTPQSRGNAIGVGLADFTTSRLVRAIDWEATTLNALTAHSIQGAKTPLHFETDREVIAKALGTLALGDSSLAKVVRIADTLSLHVFEASEAYCPVIAGREDVETLSCPEAMGFGEDGNLAPFLFQPPG